MSEFIIKLEVTVKDSTVDSAIKFHGNNPDPRAHQIDRIVAIHAAIKKLMEIPVGTDIYTISDIREK